MTFLIDVPYTNIVCLFFSVPSEIVPVLRYSHECIYIVQSWRINLKVRRVSLARLISCRIKVSQILRLWMHY